jgi:serine/threonine protein kinase
VRRFGPYLLLEKLGAGGMGEVWLARVESGGVENDCVVKLIKPDKRAGEAERRFIDEARVASMLEPHPNIAGAFDVGRVDEDLYLAMEYVPGVDGRALVTRGAEPPPPAVTAAIIDDVLSGLAAAHASTHPVTGHLLGVVHRDVSPHNIIVGFDGAARVIDFGLALSTMKQEKTETGIVLGKLPYMAPEHARGQEVDPRADLFSVGVVLYELLAGLRFYGAREYEEIWHLAAEGGFAPPDLDELGPIAPVLRRAWAPLDDRYARAEDMRAALREAASRASKDEVAAWLRARFGAARDAADARAARHRGAFAPEDPTVPNHISLLAELPTEPDDVIYQAPGVHGVARIPAPGIVHIVLRGHGDADAAAWQTGVVDEEIERVGHATFYSDVYELTTHDAGMRKHMTAWQKRTGDRVAQLVLFRSRLVVFAISMANRLTGGGAEVTSSRARFDQELATAIARGGLEPRV